jgi:hypothetical protein
MNDSVYKPPSARVEDHMDGDANDVAIRTAHVTHEASLRSFGFIYYTAAVITVGSGAAVLIDASSAAELTDGFSTLGIFIVFSAMGVGFSLIGWGLRGLKRGVRIPASITAVFGLAGFPVGTLFNGYFLWLIWSKKGQMVFSDAYPGIRERTPTIKHRTSVLVWITFGLLMVMFLFGLGAVLFNAP